MSRSIASRWWKRPAAVALLGAAVGMSARNGASNAAETYDLVVANGRVMDPESGLDAVRNVGIRGGKIAAVSSGPLEGKQTIEAQGLVIAPGFIDLHEHGQEPRNYQFQAHDGVTTSLELEAGTADVDQWYARRDGKSLINFGVAIGHIPVRMKIMKDAGTFLPVGDAARREATAAELQQIDNDIENGLLRGALAVGMREHGLDVTTECYPYTAGSTQLESAIFDPGWQDRQGITFKDIQWTKTGERLTAESFEKYRKEGGTVVIFSIPEEAARTAVSDPTIMIASDGMPLTGAKVHPRGQATFSRVLGHYVREEKALDLMTALRKMTLMPAQRLEKRAPMFRDKGRIRVGADADITVFDTNLVIDKATYESPLQYSEGIQFVLVNGVPVVRNGQLVEGVFPGRAARAPVSQ
jgi:N-acyl-D-aspartate/D-glutamate deacylase